LTPNAKGKSSVEQVSGIDASRRPSTPGAKAKAVGVSRVNQMPCSFLLLGRCSKGENCMFSHATQQVDSKPSSGQPVNTERGRSSSNEKGKRSTSKSKSLTCFKFLKGNCDAGDSCRWLHIKEENDAKELQRSTKSDSLAAVEVSSEVAMPCVAFDSDDDDDDDGCHFAGVCTEVCAAFMDEDDDRMVIGRRHPRSKIAASRNLLMPDEFTESKIKGLREEIRKAEVGEDFVSTKVPRGYFQSEHFRKRSELERKVALRKA
jgi:hypothetical protein